MQFHTLLLADHFRVIRSVIRWEIIIVQGNPCWFTVTEGFLGGVPAHLWVSPCVFLYYILICVYMYIYNLHTFFVWGSAWVWVAVWLGWLPQRLMFGFPRQQWILRNANISTPDASFLPSHVLLWLASTMDRAPFGSPVIQGWLFTRQKASQW